MLAPNDGSVFAMMRYQFQGDKTWISFLIGMEDGEEKRGEPRKKGPM